MAKVGLQRDNSVGFVASYKFTPEEVTKVTLRLMDDVWVQSRIRGNYEKLRRQLGSGKVAERVVDAVEKLLTSSAQQQTKE